MLQSWTLQNPKLLASAADKGLRHSREVRHRFADDAVLVNTRGAKFTGKDNIRKFIQANVDHKVQVEVQNLSPQVKEETVTLTDKYTTDFFERWGIGYVEFKTDVLVRAGKIRSQINYITPEGLLKIERACDTPRGRIVVEGASCDDFLRRAKAQTKSVDSGK